LVRPPAAAPPSVAAQVKQALHDATDAAYELGVIGVPTIAIDDDLFWGDDRLEDASGQPQRVRARAPARRRCVGSRHHASAEGQGP
jgi:hypothetical protein